MYYNNDGLIPYPSKLNSDIYIGSHAMLMVGYDDNKKITNPFNGVTTTGAFLIMNSWSIEWGEAGFGWIPYVYISTSSYDKLTEIGRNLFCGDKEKKIKTPLIDEIYAIEDATAWNNGIIFEVPYINI